MKTKNTDVRKRTAIRNMMRFYKILNNIVVYKKKKEKPARYIFFFFDPHFLVGKAL